MGRNNGHVVLAPMEEMHHVEAQAGGLIESVLVEDGQEVDADQQLFTIV